MEVRNTPDQTTINLLFFPCFVRVNGMKLYVFATPTVQRDRHHGYGISTVYPMCEGTKIPFHLRNVSEFPSCI